MRKIYIAPVGTIPSWIIDSLLKVLHETFNHDIHLFQNLKNPKYAYDPKRDQYYSTLILKRLEESIPEDGKKILGVTQVDLFVPIFTFVFGEAMMEGRAAVISTHRLNPKFYSKAFSRSIFISRIIKEAVHELGHTFGLTHCRLKKCVMYSSSKIVDTDYKDIDFCPTCKDLLYWNMEKGI